MFSPPPPPEGINAWNFQDIYNPIDILLKGMGKKYLIRRIQNAQQCFLIIITSQLQHSCSRGCYYWTPTGSSHLFSLEVICQELGNANTATESTATTGSEQLKIKVIEKVNVSLDYFEESVHCFSCCHSLQPSFILEANICS